MFPQGISSTIFHFETIVGCYTTDGNDIKIGQKVMDYDKNSIYECFG